MAKYTKPAAEKRIDNLTHNEATRPNLPSAEHQPIVPDDMAMPRTLRYKRNVDLDPQLVWRGKDVQDETDLLVKAPPLYIQERVHPKALIDDLKRISKKEDEPQLNLFNDFNGLPKGAEKTEFYQHQGHWTNRMILGDSLQVMASLAEREELRGKVQCIYFDPPYGIKFNSNFQWSTKDKAGTSSDSREKITREPEMVKAFRDTWRDGIHSYLSYIRDRLTVARDLLTDSGSIFVQIGDENVHRVRAVLDEVFGDENFVSQILFSTTSAFTTTNISREGDYLLYYAKSISQLKSREIVKIKKFDGNDPNYRFCLDDTGEIVPFAKANTNQRIVRYDNVSSQGASKDDEPIEFNGVKYYTPKNRHWTNGNKGTRKLIRVGRVKPFGNNLAIIRHFNDNPTTKITNVWSDTSSGGFNEDKVYVVQTTIEIVKRCILMSTDPGDLVLDPTCGSGTTAYVAEQWGRRWITIDTSRVALALARARIMGARYPWYLMADSPEGQQKEAEVTRTVPKNTNTFNRMQFGFVYERVPHITLKSIAINTEIDTIYDTYQTELEPIREALNHLLDKTYQEWELPRGAISDWPDEAAELLAQWWKLRIARQKEIDACIAARANFRHLYDRPYEDKKRVRVAGPFTVESLSPHRMLGPNEDGDFVPEPMVMRERGAVYGHKKTFAEIILDNIRLAGVQQAHKEDRISFTSLEPAPYQYLTAKATYLEGDLERRAGILIGPEYGNLGRQDLVDAAREAGDLGFEVLICFAFNYETTAAELTKLGKVHILQARMNADLHMAQDLKTTGKGNLFVIFGEPDIELLEANGQYQVKVNGVDTFHPATGEVKSVGTDGIACWFIDTDYNSEAFFVRHAYFLGANDPYSSLKTTLKAEIDADAWASLNSDISRPFVKPDTGRIAVKVINHLGDEVLKVMRVG
jgi:adenine-specific DNA-methyltransferase